MSDQPAPTQEGYYYAVCHVTIYKGEHILFNEYVLLNPEEAVSDPNQPPQYVIQMFEALKREFAGLHQATIAASLLINANGAPVRAQRFKGFDVVLHKCPEHENAKGAWCQFCGRRLFRIVIRHNMTARQSRGFLK